jgi:hypothetical protein
MRRIEMTQTSKITIEQQQAEHPTVARMCYMIIETKRAADGGFIPCIAKEGTNGFYLTDWNYGTDLDRAEDAVDELNKRLGLTETDVVTIMLSTL